MKIITRHAAVPNWLKQLGFEGDILTHLEEKSIVSGETYIGILPIPLIKKILDAGSEFILLSLPEVASGQRGQELSPDEMTAAGACLHRITVIGMEPVQGLQLPAGWKAEPVWVHADGTKCTHAEKGNRDFTFCRCGHDVPWDALAWGAKIIADQDIFTEYLGKDDQGYDCDVKTNIKILRFGVFHATQLSFFEYVNDAYSEYDSRRKIK